MPVIPAIAAVAFAQNRSVQAEFDHIAQAMARCYNTRKLADLAKFFDARCVFQYRSNLSRTMQQQIDTLAQYYGAIPEFKVSIGIHVVGSTANTVHAVETMVYSVTQVRGDARTTNTYRRISDEVWQRAASGWRMSLARVHPADQRGPDGKWAAYGANYEPEVKVHPGGGSGPAPIAALKKVLTALARSFNHVDTKAADRILSPSFYELDVNGASISREDTLKALARYAGYAGSLDYRSNFLIIAWTKDTATLTSRSQLAVVENRNGRSAWQYTRQEAESWWILTQSGWQLDHTKVWSSAYRDAQGQWHTTRARN